MERITREQILARLADRVIVMDGAMGTLLMQQARSCNLLEQQLQCITSSPCTLNLTNLALVAQVHRDYIRAGAELIETNTFNLQASLSPDSSLDNLYEMSRRGAEIARKVAEEEGLVFFLSWRKEWGPRRAIVAGCIAATSDSIAEYERMAEGLLDGGADVLLVESIYNLSYAEAALRGIQTVLKRKFTDTRKGGVGEKKVVAAKEESIENKVLAQNRVDVLEEESVTSVPDKESIVSVPIMASATIDREGRILSGEDIRTLFSRLGKLGLSGAEGGSAFSGAEGKSGLFSVGLNCSEGAEVMIPYAAELAEIAAANVGDGGTAGDAGVDGTADDAGCAGRLAVSICPSAGLPDADGRYPETPEFWASCVRRMIAGADSGAMGISEKYPAFRISGKHSALWRCGKRPAYIFAGGCCGTTPEYIKAVVANTLYINNISGWPCSKNSTGSTI